MKSQNVTLQADLDNRNSSSRPANFYELIVDQFNDEEWVAVSEIVQPLHKHFVEEYKFPNTVKSPFAWKKNVLWTSSGCIMQVEEEP